MFNNEQKPKQEKEKELMAKKPELKKLQEAAEELNKILKPDPPIRFTGVKTVDLIKHVKMAGALLEEGDKITKEMSDLFSELEVDVDKSVKVVTPKTAAVSKKKVDPETK